VIGLALMAMRKAYAGEWTSPPERACGCVACKAYFRLIDALPEHPPQEAPHD
jgi:hypothetical protein